MLDFAIFAVTFVTALIIAVIWLYPTAKKQTTIPGLEPSDPKEGNLPDIRKTGSLHEFLLETHKTHGPIISFWMGEKMTISISSPELFSEHASTFDRPPDIFKLFEPLIGAKSIQFANGADARQRRKLYDNCYSHQEVSALYPLLNEMVEELINKWATMVDDQHIPVRNHMTALALKSIAKGSFGDYFNDDKAIMTFRKCYDICWNEIERTVSSVPSTPGSAEEKRYKSALEQLKSMIAEIIKHRRNNSPTDERLLLIDVILQSDFDDEQKACDVLAYMIGGFHTTGSLMTWAFYFLATHSDVQDKLFKEVSKTLNIKEEMTPDMVKQMPYLQQVVDETLRCAVVGPIAARYKPDTDTTLGGHVVPQGTPVIHALGVCFQDEKLYPQPHKFDPERFSKEQLKTRPPHSFEPFGFAGKRKCPGYRFSQTESYIFIARIIRQFKLKMVPDQVITPVYGLVTQPDEEIWITISERNQ
ncbi:cytochrome P450 20A1-like [Tubulanus polymorphus]|uniref:cytochrome P450 20A1-like n=1 Tax=Tubulanus polymorphus TaxID=672921 RepID=UPI003DA64E8A